MALDEFAKLASDFGFAISGLAAGVIGTYQLMKRVNKEKFDAITSGNSALIESIERANNDRIESLNRGIEFLKEQLAHTRKEVEHTEKQCEARMETLQQNNNALNDRIKTLEDSRTFILTNYIKKDYKND